MFTKRLFSHTRTLQQRADVVGGADETLETGLNKKPTNLGILTAGCKTAVASALLALSCSVSAQEKAPTAPVADNNATTVAIASIPANGTSPFALKAQPPSAEALARYSDQYIFDLYNEGVSKKMRYKEGIVDPDGTTYIDYITLFMSEDAKPLLKKLQREDKEKYSDWLTKVTEAGMGRGFGNTGMRYQFESIRDGLARIAAGEARIAAGEARIAAGEAKNAELDKDIKTAEEAHTLLNFVGYSVLISIGNNTTPEQNKEYGTAFRNILSDNEARKIFETDGTLDLALTLQDALLRGDTLIQIRKDLLQSIARVVVLKQPIIKQADAINPGTESGFRGPLSKLAEISGVNLVGS